MHTVNVLMLVSNLRVSNGVASFAMNYFRGLDHVQVHMDFALYSDRPSPYYDEIKQAGSGIYILPSVKNLKQHIKCCEEILKSGKYDIIHDNTLHVTIPMMWCAKRVGIPVRILHSHNSKLGETTAKELRNKAFLPVLKSLATDYTACSDLAGKAMFGSSPFDVVPNVIAANKYCFDQEKRLTVRRTLNPEDKYVIGTVGRLAEQKNPFFAIDVFSRLVEKFPNTEYWWIGSGNLDAQVADYVASKGLAGSVKLFGSRNDVLDLYQAMDCFFLPSLFEGLPVTGVEAQAMGLPMVVSDSVTNEMTYTDLVDFVSLNESFEVWAKHLKYALEWNVDREIYAERLKQSIFSDGGCGNRLMGIYKRMLKIE